MIKLNKNVSQILIGVLSALLTVFLIYVSRNLLLPIHLFAENNIPTKSLVTTIVLLLALLLVLFLYTYYLFKKVKTKLFIKLGLKWDEYKNPHCPNCETVISVHQEGNIENFWCPKCKTSLSGYDPETGERLGHEATIKMINSLNII